MSSLLASSDGMVLVYAFGSGMVVIVLLLIGVTAILGGNDRRALYQLVRHPIQQIFTEEPREPDPPDPPFRRP